MILREKLLACQKNIAMDDGHIYRVKVGDKWEVFTGTTTCIGSHMPKEWLGPWYAKEMALEIGDRLAAMPDPLERRSVLDAVNASKTAAKRRSGAAMGHGTDLHGMAEAFCRSRLGEIVEVPRAGSPEVTTAWESLKPWLATVTPIMVEFPVYSLTERYAGMGDLLCENLPMCPEGVTILDYKTDSAATPKLKVEWKLQNYAYRGAVREMTGVLPNGVVAVLSKTIARPPVLFNIPWDEEGYTVFKCLLKAYRWSKNIGV